MLKIGVLSLFALVVPSLHAIHSIELNGGSELRGVIVLERPDAYYVDLGFDIISVPKEAVIGLTEVSAEGSEAVVDTPNKMLYRMSEEGGDQPIREWIGRLGEAVALCKHRRDWVLVS